MLLHSDVLFLLVSTLFFGDDQFSLYYITETTVYVAPLRCIILTHIHAIFWRSVISIHYNFLHRLVYFSITMIFSEAFWVIKTVVGKYIPQLTTFRSVSGRYMYDYIHMYSLLKTTALGNSIVMILLEDLS